jgi:uncharacterized protein
MDRNEVITRLKSVEPMLRARGVGALYLFGSYARDEAAQASDVDIFVDPADSDEFGLIPLFDSQAIVESILPGLEIGFSTRDSIVPRYRPYIELDAIRIF